MSWEEAVSGQGPQGHEHEPALESPSAVAGDSRQDQSAPHAASAAGSVPAAGSSRRADRRAKERKSRAAALIGAVVITLISVVFIVSFMGALHKPGPRSVPLGIVGTSSQASALSGTLDHQAPGGFTVASYPTQAAATSAITGRSIDAALVPGRRVQLLLVATAVGPAVTSATIKDVHAAVHAAGALLAVKNIHPLPANDPEGISQVFFVVALLAPSLVFGNLLMTRIGAGLHPFEHLAAIVIYAVIVGAVAAVFSDAVVGALVGAPWGLFGIGTLLAFAAAVMAAAVARWGGGIGYLLLFLLFIPVGIASSGTTLGPNMIISWYADLGKGPPAGSALPAVQNTVYFNGNAITVPLLVLSGWALAGAIALALVAILHPPMPGQRRHSPDQAAGAAAHS
jgi:MFS family permease